MVILDTIRQLLNIRKKRILLYAEAALSGNQYQAFRKLLLDEMGSTGLERDLVRVIAEQRHKNR